MFSLLFLVAIPFISADGFDINVTEKGKVTSFYDSYYIARINGSLTITNPSENEFFNVIIPLYLSSYTIRSANNTPTNFIDETGIYILSLPANSSISFDYRIGGISTEDLTAGGKALLETAISAYDLKIYSNVLGSLFKAPFEDLALTGRNNTRLISVHLTNPSSFEFNVDMIKVIKTPSLDPSVQLDSWDFSSQMSTLPPRQTSEFDFFDENAFEGEVYWLQTDIYLDEINLYSNPNITSFDQDDLFIPLDNATNITYNETSLEFFDKRVFIRKLISSNLAIPGQLMNVTLIVNNFGSTSLQGVLTDEIPFGFNLNKVYTSDSTTQENILTWDVDVSPRTAQRFVYELKFVDEDSIGVDYFTPATIAYGSDFIYSQSVPYVRQYVSEKKIYMQKSLDFRPNGDVEVAITVRNLGETSLANLMVKEYLGPGDEFKEITKPFREKGVWIIEDLKAGEIWETSYVTDKTNVLNAFPELFGVPRSGLFRNIILKNVVESKFKILETSTVEILGLSLLALVLCLYIIPHSTLLYLKKRFVSDLRMTDSELKNLKKASSSRVDFHPNKPSVPSSSRPQSSAPVNNEHTPSEFSSARQEKLNETQAILEQIKQRMNKE